MPSTTAPKPKPVLTPLKQIRVEPGKSFPGILLNTIPKSGSIYLANALCRGLGIPFMRISGDWFPGDVLVPDQLRILAAGNAVTQEHLDANPQNRVALNVILDRLVVHVRDPRMTTLEWVHHLITERALHGPEATQLQLPELVPPGFFDLSMSEKIDHQIDHLLPVMIGWLTDWVDASEDAAFRSQILFTRYDDMVADEPAFYRSILDFYGIAESQFSYEPFQPRASERPELEGEFHFRNKRTDEWRDVFTPAQLDRACAMMPKRLLKRFDWPER